jgi:hypothetical protein
MSIDNISKVNGLGSYGQSNVRPFRAMEYVASNRDLILAVGANAKLATEHYLQFGIAEGRETSTFDALEYVASNPDLIIAFRADTELAAEHYVRYGFAEGRSTNAFNAMEYVASNPDLIIAFGANRELAAKHYIQYGLAEGRSTSAFNAMEYVASNPDLVMAFGANTELAAKHYIQYGLAEGRSTSAFNAMEYVASNPDLIIAFGANTELAAKHYIQYGLAEGRSVASFDPDAYIDARPELQTMLQGDPAAAIDYYVRVGFNQGHHQHSGSAEPAGQEGAGSAATPGGGIGSELPLGDQSAAELQVAASFQTSPTAHGWGGVDPELYRGAAAINDSSLSLTYQVGQTASALGNPNLAHVVTVALGTTAAQLDTMIANADRGTTFLLEKGTYTFDQQIDVRHGDITIKGAGVGETTIMVTGITRADAIRVQAPWQKENWGDIEGSEAKLNTMLKVAAGEHDMTITLGSTTNLKVGDFLEISQKNIPESGDKNADFLGTMAEITGIDAAAGRVTLTHEIGFDAVKGATVRAVELLHNVVLGDFTIDYGAPTVTVDPYRYVNNNVQYVGQPGMESVGVRAIFLNDVANGAVYNVEIKNAGSNGLGVRGVVGLEVNGLTVDGVQNLGEGGNGYGLEIARSYHSTYENLNFEGLVRHSVTFSKDGSSAYNNVHVASASANVDFHGGPDYKNIYYIERMDLSQLKDDYAFNGIDYRDSRNESQNTVVFDSFKGADSIRITSLDASYEPINYTGYDSATALNSYSASRDDIVYGSSNDGIINTGAGNDTIYSGSGDQKIYTGAGADKIIFGAMTGHDEIFGFDVNRDKIQVYAGINGSGVMTSSDLLTHAQSDGYGNVLLALGGGHDVLVHLVSLSQLDASNLHVI